MDMMSVYSQPDGSLYDEPSVENFHKPGHIVRAGSHPELNVNVAYHQGSSAAVPQSLPSLSTPDLLSTISGSISTTTQSISSPTPFGVRDQVTAEQEMYAQGFIDELRGLESAKPSVSSMSLIGDGPRSVVHPTSQAGLPGVGSIDATPGFTNSHTLESVAQTYVTATRDYINISAPHTESTSAYGASSSHNYVNAYPSPMFSMYTPSIDTYGGYVTAGQPTVPGGVIPGGAMPPQMVKELQRVVPADMKTQEQMKVERKKARNRIAASKCRLRRLQRESELQSKVKMLKDHNQELNNEVSELKEQINNLKRALVQHMQGGCQVNVPEGYSLSPN